MILRGGPELADPGALSQPTTHIPGLLGLLAGFALARRSDCRSTFENLEGEPAIVSTYGYLIAGTEGSVQHHPREAVIHPALDGPPQGARSELRIEALFGQELERSFGELYLDA